MKIQKYNLLVIILLFISCEGPIFDVPEEPDTTPPILTITFPPDQAILSDTVLVTAYAFDDDELEIVNVYLNDSVIIDSKEGPFEFNWITNNFEDDESYTIYATAEDISGNTNQTNPIQVTIDNEDNVNPTGTLIFPYTGQTLNGEITMIVEANDNEGVDSVIFYIDGSSVAADLEEPYSYTWDTTVEVDDISYTIHVHVIDIAGNKITLGPISVLIDNYESADNVPPTGTITYPPASASLSGIVDIQVTAFDNVEMGSVEFLIDGFSVFTDYNYPYQYSWDTNSATEDSDHFINVTITDWVGNSTSLFSVTVYVDNISEPDITPPTVVLSEPAANQTVDGVVSIVAIASDNIGINRVELYHGDSQEIILYNYPYEYSWDTTQEEDDTEHSWYARAFDTSENNSQTQPISVFVDNINDTYPSGQILYPYAGQTVNGIVEIQVNAYDDEGISSVNFILNGIDIYNDTNEPYIYEWDTQSYNEDEETSISINIVDDAGNITGITPIVVLVNNEPDLDDTTPPVVSLITPVSGQTVSDTFQVTGFANDNVGIDNVKFYIDDVLVETVIDSPYIYFWNTFNLSNNSEHTIWIKAQDLYGNTSNSQPSIVTIDNIYSETINNLALNLDVDVIEISWDAPSNAESYKIYRDGNFLIEITDQYFEDQIDGGVEYCYQISAVNPVNIEGPLSTSSCGIPLLPSPITFEASVDENDVTLIWNDVNNATNYSINRDGDIIWTGSETTYLDDNLDFNTTYIYTVTPIDFEGTSGTTSNPLSVTTNIELTAPELTISIGTNEVTLNWTSVSSADAYRVYIDDALEIEVSDLSYTFTVNGGASYCYKVSAINEYGTESPFSNTECGEALFPAPDNFSGSVSQNSISFTWSEVNNASSYSLSRDGNEIYNGTDLTYDDTGLDFGTTYNYTIETINSSGIAGESSNALELTTYSELVAPILSVTINGATATLNWSSVSIAVNYYIYATGSFVIETSNTEYDYDLTPGNQVCFSIIALDANGNQSPGSNEECGEAILEAPRNFSGSVSQNNISLSWAEVSGATSYSLSRDGDEIYNGTNLTYDDTGLDFGTTYNYTIETINSSGIAGESSDPIEFITHDLVNPPVLSISITGSTATLNWTTISSANHYFVYQDDVFIEQVTNGVTLDVEIGTDSERCFTVSAVDEYDTESAQSNEECGTGS